MKMSRYGEGRGGDARRVINAEANSNVGERRNFIVIS